MAEGTEGPRDLVGYSKRRDLTGFMFAARIAGQATGGEILVSSLLRELTASGGDIEFGEPRSVELKGLAGVQEMFPVSWQST